MCISGDWWQWWWRTGKRKKINEPTPTQGYGVSLSAKSFFIDSRVGELGIPQGLNWGFQVHVHITAQERMTAIPDHQLTILKNMGSTISNSTQLLQSSNPYDLIIDGIIGYSIKENPRGSAAEMIEWANEYKAPILSLDTPSGIDLTSGRIHPTSISANATLTLALPKKGLYAEKVKKKRGELYLGDISVPPELYQYPLLEMEIPPLFNTSDIIRID